MCPGFPVLPAALLLVFRSKIFEPVEYALPVALGQGMANAQLDHARSTHTRQGFIDPAEIVLNTTHQRIEGHLFFNGVQVVLFNRQMWRDLAPRFHGGLGIGANKAVHGSDEKRTTAQALWTDTGGDAGNVGIVALQLLYCIDAGLPAVTQQSV